MRIRLLTILIIVSLLSVFSMSVTVSSSAVTSADGPQSADVSVRYISGKVKTVYSVNIEWTDMTFTYYAGEGMIWDSEKHEYSPMEQGWSNGGKATITVTNESNCAVDVNVDYAPNKSDIVVEGSVKGGSFSLPSAVGKTVGDESLSASAELTLSDNLPTVSKTVNDINAGTVTVTVTASDN